MSNLISTKSLGRSSALALALASVAATPALAGTTYAAADTSSCSTQPFSQPFQSFRDSNWYTLAPGQTSSGFDGGGWTLSGGARITPTQLQDGRSGSVLDLPSGSKATSPAICVTSDYPTARTRVRNVVGSEGVGFYVSYAGTRTWDAPQDTGSVHGDRNIWTLSNRINVQPGRTPGWQLVRFILVAKGTRSDFHLYDFYVDPRMKG